MSEFNSSELKEELMAGESRTLQSLRELITYCIENNSTISDEIEFREEYGSGIGVFVANNCKKGVSLISIPRNMCISAERIRSYPPLQAIFVDYPNLAGQPDEILAIGLMYALLNEDINCPWIKHVKTLPRKFNTTIFWSEEELNELKGHNLYYLTNMLNQRISSDFSSIFEPIIAENPEILQNADLDIYAWALSVVYSRSLDISRKNKHERVIVPVLDMLNHNPHAAGSPSETFHYDEETDNISYISPSDLEPGAQCFAVYGHYPNAKLLYTYGFVVHNNPFKAIDLWTRVTPHVQGFEFKQKILQENELTNDQTYDFKGTIRPNYVSPRLLSTIRVIQADATEFSNIDAAFEGRMISTRNELATYTSLKNLLRLRLKAEVAEMERKHLGELLLSNTPNNNRRLMALIVKVEERELVQEIIGLVDDWISELTSVGTEFRPQDAK